MPHPEGGEGRIYRGGYRALGTSAPGRRDRLFTKRRGSQASYHRCRTRFEAGAFTVFGRADIRLGWPECLEHC